VGWGFHHPLALPHPSPLSSFLNDLIANILGYLSENTDRVRLLFVGGIIGKTAFHCMRNSPENYNEGQTKIYEAIIEKLPESFKDEFDLAKHNLGSLEEAQAGCPSELGRH
jgi:hypothetical protein